MKEEKQIVHEITQLTKDLLDASSKYYNSGSSPLSDKEFDEKLEKLKMMEETHHFRLNSSPTVNVGAPVLNFLNKKSVGERPMLSLDKCGKAEDIIKFAKGKQLVASVKVDGLSVRLTYKNGKLFSAVTRGNGYEGTDVTEHVKHFLNVPLEVGTENLIIDGEAVIKRNDFAIVNQEGQFKNPRNTAAGALNLLDMKEVKERRLSFIVWDVIDGLLESRYDSRMIHIQMYGFEIVPLTKEPIDVKDKIVINNTNEKVLNWAEEQGIPCDGVVWKFNDLEYGESLGRTEKFFRNAIAYKPKDEEAETTLIDIEWGMGRDGHLTPIAIYKEVELLGSVCNRASLHNLDIMKDTLGSMPHTGQKITIVKSKMIIPQIIKADKSEMSDNDIIIDVPLYCPYCGKPTEIRETELTHHLFCTNGSCNGRLNNVINHYCSKKGLDIKHISEKVIDQLIDFGWLNKISDLYSLKNHREEWIKKAGWGIKSVDRILESIEDSKKCKLVNFLAAIGVSQCSLVQMKEIVKICPTYDIFRTRVRDKWNFTTINGISDVRWLNIIHFDYTEADEISKSLSFEEEAETREEDTQNSPILGLTFVITGKMSAPFKKRDELVEYIETFGGKVSSSVSNKTHYLINNDKTSTTAKNKRAIELGVPIITVDEFIELVK